MRLLITIPIAALLFFSASCTTTMYGIKGEYKGRPTSWTVMGRDDPEDVTGATDGWYRYKIPSEEVSNVQLTGFKWFFGFKKEEIYSFEVPKKLVEDILSDREEWNDTPEALNRPFGF